VVVPSVLFEVVIVDNAPPIVTVFNVDNPTTVNVTFVPAAPDIKLVATVGAPSIVRLATALSIGKLVVVRFTV